MSEKIECCFNCYWCDLLKLREAEKKGLPLPKPCKDYPEQLGVNNDFLGGFKCDKYKPMNVKFLSPEESAKFLEKIKDVKFKTYPEILLDTVKDLSRMSFRHGFSMGFITGLLFFILFAFFLGLMMANI